MECIHYATGVVFVDVEWVQRTYGAALIRVTNQGDVEAFVDNDGYGWVNIAELDPVSTVRN